MPTAADLLRLWICVPISFKPSHQNFTSCWRSSLSLWPRSDLALVWSWTRSGPGLGLVLVWWDPVPLLCCRVVVLLQQCMCAISCSCSSRCVFVLQLLWFLSCSLQLCRAPLSMLVILGENSSYLTDIRRVCLCFRGEIILFISFVQKQQCCCRVCDLVRQNVSLLIRRLSLCCCWIQVHPDFYRACGVCLDTKCLRTVFFYTSLWPFYIWTLRFLNVTSSDVLSDCNNKMEFHLVELFWLFFLIKNDETNEVMRIFEAAILCFISKLK